MFGICRYVGISHRTTDVFMCLIGKIQKKYYIVVMNSTEKSILHTIYFFSLSIIFAICMLFSCTTVKKTNSSAMPVIEEQPDITNQAAAAKPVDEGTVLSVPSKEKLAEKRLDSRLAANLIKGSPKSLENALTFIQNDSKGLTTENRLYLKVITELMHLVYPEEAGYANYDSSNEDHPYLIGLRSVKNGIYPLSMKKDSFISLIIPPLILTVKNANASIINEFAGDITERIEAAKKMHPDSVLPHYLLGILNEKQYNISAAAAFYKTAWNLDNSCYPAGLNYGRLSADLGDGQTAIKIAEILSEKKQDTASVKLLYARGYIASSDFTKANENVIDVLKKEPENISALLLRICILIEQKEYLKANALLDAYSTKNKTAKEYLLYRARISREWNKNLTGAAEFLKEAYRLYPEDFNILLACAEICFETSQEIENKKADFFIAKVLEKDAENAAALSLLIKNGINEGNWEQAVSLATKLVNKVPVNANKELLIRSYLGAGQFEQALSLSKQLYFSTKNVPNNFVGLYIEALSKTGNNQAVLQIIKEKLPTADSDLKSVLYYYNAKSSKGSSEEYLSSLRSSLLANPRNKDSLFAMYEWYFNNKDYRKAKYYLGQVIALDPANKKNNDLAEKLNKLLAD